MRAEPEKIQRRLAITTLYVTHDRIETMTLSDTMAVMKCGKIQRTGAPIAAYDRPADTSVAEFSGTPPVNLLHANILEKNGKLFIMIEYVSIQVRDEKKGSLAGTQERSTIVGMRPEALSVSQDPAEEGNRKITLIEHPGSEMLAQIQFGAERTVIARLPGGLRLTEGDTATLHIDARALHFFKREDDTILQDAAHGT